MSSAPQRRYRLAWIIPAAIAAFVVLGSVAGNLIADDLKEFYKAHSRLMQIVFVLSAIAAAIGIYWDHRQQRKADGENMPPPPVSQSGNRNINSQGNNNLNLTGNAGRDVVGQQIVNQTFVQPLPAPRFNSLHQLPSPKRDFTGREKELAQLANHLKTGFVISGVQGLGGVGKTELALKFADNIKASFPDAQFFLDLRGAGDNPVSPADALAHVIRAFEPEYRAPDSEDEIATRYRSLLDGKRALIVWDDAKDRAHVAKLTPPPTCLMIVTSRQRFALAGMEAIELDKLPPDEAVELLHAICSRTAGNAAELARLCGYLPLALRAVGSYLQEYRDTDPAEYATRLQREILKLTAAKAEGAEISIEASFNLSYERLEPETSAVFRRLAVFPATFDAAAAEFVCEDKGHRNLSQLVRLSLAQFDDKERRYRLHDLTRLFADERLDDAERETRQLRYAQHFLDVLTKAQELYLEGGDKVKVGMELFDRERANIEAGQSWAASHREANLLAAMLCAEYPNAGGYVINLRLHPHKRIRWLEKQLAAARQLLWRNYEGAALGSLGTAYRDLGEPRKATEFYEQRLLIAREIGDRQGEGNALVNLGGACYLLADTRRAIEFHERALLIYREIGDRRGEGNAMGSLGLAYADLAEATKAIEFYEQCLAIACEIGDRRDEGSTLGNLGNAYAILGELHKAIEFHEQYLAIAREIGDQRGEGTALWNMALALNELGERGRAVKCAETALEIYEEIEDPNAEKVRRQLAEWRK